MSITAEKIALDAAKLPKRVTDDDAHAIISGPEKWSFIKGYAYALLQQGEPEGFVERAKVVKLIDDELFSREQTAKCFEADNPTSEASRTCRDKWSAIKTLKRHFEECFSTSPLPPAPGAETDPSAEDCAKITAAQVGNEKLTPLSEPWGFSSSRQAALEDADYFASLVSRARAAATKATIKFPQPNYVTLKIAEEAGEVVRGCVHYAEKRMDWSEVEGEIVQLLAMLIRLVTEGDQVNGVIPPLATNPPAEGETK